MPKLNNFLVFDLETGTKEFAGRKGNPFINPIVAVGLATKEETFANYTYPDKLTEFKIDEDILVGFNMTFDLLYLWHLEDIQAFIKRGGRIWDCQLAEYMLSGQQNKYPALRETAVNLYKCPQREKLMEPYWEQGTHTRHIPKELVIEDVTYDVIDTRAIYLEQIKKAKTQGMLNLIMARMDGLLATIEIEFNGMQVDREKLLANKQALEEELKEITTKITTATDSILETTEAFNPDSPTQLSLLLFGGEIKEEYLVEIGVFKTGAKKGQIKYKKEERTKRINGLGLHPHVSWKTKKDGIYSTNEAVLSVIAKREGTKAAEICQLILKSRELRKQISTYYDSTLAFLYDDNRVHAQYIGVQTDTGRLSCKNPNLQNQPKAPSKVPEHFVSRYEEGKLIAADYAQVELVVQAVLSKDPQYIEDVLNGVDFHCKRLALKEGQDYEQVVRSCKGNPEWSKKRSQVKGFSFARAYGAGAKKIAEQTGMQEQEVLLLIEREREEYPVLSRWQESLKEEVNAKGFYRSILGRLYKFKKYPAPQWLQDRGTYEAYSPTESVNYIVQGTATGDIVLIMLGYFFRTIAIHNRHKYLLVNTVHDSIMLDCRKEYVEDATEDLQVLTQWKQLCYDYFQVNWEVSLKIDIKVGETWGDL